MSGGRYVAALAVTLVAGFWTLVVAFAMAWGGAGITAAIPALLAVTVAAVTAFLRRAPTVWLVLLVAVAAVTQVSLCAAMFELEPEDVDADALSAVSTVAFLVLGATPALVGLAVVVVALTRRGDARSQRPGVLAALGLLGVGSFLFWLFGLVAFEGATTGRDAADNLLDDAFFALLQAGPVLLYSAAASIVAPAIGRPAPVRYASWTGEAY